MHSSNFTLIEHSWPWQQRLPNAYWVTTHFEHHPLSPQDWLRHGIALPSSLNKAGPKRRAEFLAGRLCAQRALLRLQGHTYVPSIGQDKAPTWPKGTVGSITHSDHWAAALVAKQEQFLGVGIDIERCLSKEDGQKLAGTLLTANERERLNELTVEQLALMVTLIFSLKESLFKALYPLVGKRFYFEDAELVAWDNAAGTARLRLLSDLDRQWPADRELEACFALMDGHVISLVAVPNQPSSGHY